MGGRDLSKGLLTALVVDSFSNLSVLTTLFDCSHDTPLRHTAHLQRFGKQPYLRRRGGQLQWARAPAAPVGCGDVPVRRSLPAGMPAITRLSRCRSVSSTDSLLWRTCLHANNAAHAHCAGRWLQQNVIQDINPGVFTPLTSLVALSAPSHRYIGSALQRSGHE